MTIRVFLLDDHELVRTGLRSLLEESEDIAVVGEAGTVAEALARIPPIHPDVAILDVRLPDGSGVEVCREIRSQMPEIACLMLTSYADDEALFAAIMAGAAGYVLKQVGGMDLVNDVRRVANGESLLDEALTEQVLKRLRSGLRSRPTARLTDPTRATNPRSHCQRADQPPDRRRDVLGREDGEELRVQSLGQTRDGEAHPGRLLCDPTGRAVDTRATHVTKPGPDSRKLLIPVHVAFQLVQPDPMVDEGLFEP